MEQSVEWNSPLVFAIVYFERAFNTINRQAIWQRLWNSDAPCRDRFKGEESESLEAKTG